MKKILHTIIFLIIAFVVYPQQMVIKKTDGSNSKVDLNTIESINFIIPCPGTETVDYGGKIYNTVLIGNQCWLKENLDIGTMISGSINLSNNSTIEKHCYNNDPVNCDTYGGLYSWEEAMQYVTIEGAQGICPDGWHLPTLADFVTLNIAVGGDGNSIKAVGQGYGSGAGTNTFGFSALLAGYRNPGGYFGELASRTHFWSSKREPVVTSLANQIYLWDDRADISFHVGEYSTYGFSVRCIKD